MKIKAETKWHCRYGGGLFLGFRFHFPISIVDDRDINKSWTTVYFSIGFLIFTVCINVDYNFT